MKNTIALHIRPKAQGSLEILLYEDIGEGFFGGGVTSKAIREQLQAAGLVDSIHVRINSIGGDVSDGFAIYNALKEHPAHVTTHIDADAMSIASIIALAGDTRVIAANARIMIHEARAIPGQLMTERDIESTLQNIRGVNETIVSTYVKHTGQTPEQIREWMAAETYMSATQALERGFVDQIAGSDSERIAAWSSLSLEQPMTLELKTLALAIGLVATASMDDIVTEAKALKAKTKAAQDERDELILALGVDSIDAAKGAAAAAKSAINHAKTLEVRVGELEKAKAETERMNVLASIKASGKSTPALEADVFPTMSVEALVAFEKAAPTVAKSTKKEPLEPKTPGQKLTHNGKAYEDLAYSEQHILYTTDRGTYDALRSDAKARGAIR